MLLFRVFDSYYTIARKSENRNKSENPIIAKKSENPILVIQVPMLGGLWVFPAPGAA